jgi:hypothetical protein
MGSARSKPLRTESVYHQMQYLPSYKPPTLLWAGDGVRLVVDSIPPVGGSVIVLGDVVPP